MTGRGPASISDGTRLEPVVTVGVVAPGGLRAEAEEHLDELEELVGTAGGTVVARVVQAPRALSPSTLIGAGKVEEIASLVQEKGARCVVFDEELSPGQVKNLEKVLPCKVLDRAGVILDIFARRARSREARTQVELAQLNWLLPRLTRAWSHLSRQAGGIGTRGVGETQLETDRRIIQKRIGLLTQELERIGTQRGERVKRRGQEFQAALVGYTNAGKSTLLNVLTGAEVLAEDRLFATLDSVVRKLELAPHRTVLLADTVGFIRKLPHHLVASFRSTLEGVRDADLILHVVDGANPRSAEHMRVVGEVLGSLGVSDTPTLVVVNKADAMTPDQRADLAHAHPHALFVSARTGAGLDRLRDALLESVTGNERVETFRFTFAEMPRFDRVRPEVQVLMEKFDADGVEVTVRGQPASLARLRGHVPAVPPDGT